MRAGALLKCYSLNLQNFLKWGGGLVIPSHTTSLSAILTTRSDRLAYCSLCVTLTTESPSLWIRL